MARRISVIGLGYLGLVQAVCLAHEGFEVVATDVDRARVDALRRGRLPFYEPGLAEIFDGARPRLTFTHEPEDLAVCDVHLLCVGTPQSSDGRRTDTSQVFDAALALIPHLAPDALVVGKSTVPVGTAALLSTALDQTAGRDVRLAWSPEFVRQGRCVHDTLNPDRIVYGTGGACAQQDARLLDEVFAPQFARGTRRLVVDYATAELVKVAANAFLATKISFINAVAELCEQSGANVVALADAIGMDDRIGRQFLSAGLGFGGGCLPKDLAGFQARAEEYGADRAVALLREVEAVNGKARTNVVELALDLCGGDLMDRNVTVLGAAFKPLTDDVRDSPALDVARICRALGARVTVHDPFGIDNAQKEHPQLRYERDAQRAARDADVILHLTEWAEYRELDPVALGRVVRQKRIIDARHGLQAETWSRAGWSYRAWGRPLAATAFDVDLDAQAWATAR